MVPVDRIQILSGESVEDAWTDVDVSSYVTDDCVGVIVYFYTTGSPSGAIGVRKNGSTVSNTDLCFIYYDSGYFMVGVDEDKIFEYYHQSSWPGQTLDFYLAGYYREGEAVFFTDPIEKTLGIAPSEEGWEDVDVSGDTGGDTAIGVFGVAGCGPTGGVTVGFRKNGSTDLHKTKLESASYGTSFVIGVDGSEIFEVWNTDDGGDGFGALQVWLYGYIKSGATFLTDAVDYSGSDIAGYFTVDISATVPANHNGAFFIQSQGSGIGTYASDRRKNSSITSLYTQHPYLYQAWTNIDGDRNFERQTPSSDIWTYVTGYSENAASPASSGITLFIGGTSPVSSGITLFVGGADSSSSGITLYTHGKYASESGQITLFVNGIGNPNSGITLYTRGTLPANSSITLFTGGAIQSVSGMTLYTYGIATHSGIRTLYVNGAIQESGQTTLLINGSIQSTKSAPLFIRAENQGNSSIPLFISNNGSDSGLPLVVWGVGTVPLNPDVNSDGYFPFDGSHTMFIRGQGQESSVNLFIAAETGIINNERTLFLQGGPAINGNIPLVIPATINTHTTNLNVYTHGF